MRFRILSSISLLSIFLSLTPFTSAIRLLESKSLNPCQDNSNFTASLFNVVFTPDNGSIAFHIVGVSSIEGNVTIVAQVIAYGYTALNQTIDPCTAGLGGFCPMSSGQNINILSNLIVGKEVVNRIPGIAYGVPDLDGLVRIYIRLNGASENAACVEAVLSNGKSVYQKAVGWVTAIIAGLALIASAVTSGMGHSNTAAHVAANALSLFGFFQAQAIIGMTAVAMPPIVQSWTQNFQWSMGIIRIGFLQSICTWYQRATGGTPTVYLSTLATSSVQVQKRSIEVVGGLIRRGASLVTRNSSASSNAGKVIVVRGIDRVGFLAGIEQTNIFLTGLIFFVMFCFFVAILVALFKVFCETAVKAGWMMSDKFADFRNGWKIVLKGILFRLVLIGYPQMCILCLWELVERDSAAEVILALVVFCSMTVALGWAALKVIRLAKRSVMMHKNPAYMLYSDPTCLNKWGFLYVQYRATAYYFVLPVLAYILVKAIFIAFCQGSDVVQVIGLVIIEAVALIGVSVLRPWMDKRTNIFNISIAAINFVNVVFLLVFTGVFGQPAIVTGVMGVLFALYNIIFAAILLIMVLIASVYALASKNPDTRYQPMRDDRGSFIKSQSALTTELDALGATARGDTKEEYSKERGFGSDDESFSSESLRQREPSGVPLPPSTANSAYRPATAENRAMFANDNTVRRGPINPNSYDNHSAIIDAYQDEANGHEYHSGYNSPDQYQGGAYNNGYERTALAHSYNRGGPQFRPTTDSSPLRRGAGGAWVEVDD